MNELLELYLGNSALVYFTVVVITASLVYQLSESIQVHFADDKNKLLADWLAGKYQSSWVKHFNQFFDSIFGEKHFSFKCFFRSCVGSLIAVIILFVVFDGAFDFFSGGVHSNARIESELSFYQVLGLCFALNFVPDYVSLLQTRCVLQFMESVSSTFYKLLLMLADLLLTATISALYILLIIKLFFDKEDALGNLIAAFSPYSIFFYSAFFTSVWGWLYFLTTWTVRVSSSKGLQNWLDYSKQPVMFLGALIAIWFVVISMVIYPLTKSTSQEPNLIERIACDISGISCLRVAALTENEVEKFKWLAKACEEGVTTQCYETANAIFVQDPEQAMLLISKGIRLEPNNILALQSLAHILSMQRRFDEAEMVMQRIVDLAPGTAHSLFNLRSLRRDRARFEDTENALREQIDSNESVAAQAFLRGISFERTFQKANALVSYEQAIQANFNTALLYVFYADLLQYMFRFEEAEHAYRNALQLEPANQKAIINLGITLISLHKSIEAETLFRSAILKSPTNPDYYFGLAYALQMQNRIAEANEFQRIFLKLATLPKTEDK